jgi:hypothetical protein
VRTFDVIACGFGWITPPQASDNLWSARRHPGCSQARSCGGTAIALAPTTANRHGSYEHRWGWPAMWPRVVITLA